MEMIEIVSLTLSDYMTKVRSYATQYAPHSGTAWYELKEEDFTDEDDRDEFSFIRVALWDKLMEREFYAVPSPPGPIESFSRCGTTEPEIISGSFILDGGMWTHTITQRSLIGTSIPVTT